MKFIIAVICLLFGLMLSACSSVSMPSLSWLGSSADSNPTAEALFAEAMGYFKKKSYSTAIDRFQRFKADYPFSPRLTEAEFKIADAYYLNEQYPEAIVAFKEYQALHPTSEEIPFVIYRLGQAHYDQFTSIDRDQKNTEIAKGYFETLVTNHPNSPYAAEAKEKLANCIDYLAEHEFNVAEFYMKQEKYPAARDRLEEIVRRYRGTPTAVKSLFYLGEAYRHEKNGVKAALAYEAVIQHHPESKFAREATTRLAEVVKEKHDPLALLLMRDQRPGYSPSKETAPEPAIDKLKDLHLVAKKEVVHEEPGAEKGFFRRVADTINPFSSSDDGKAEVKKSPEPAKPETAQENENRNEKSDGFFASMWNGLNPFAGDSSNEKKQTASTESSGLVHQIDDSLRSKGIEPSAGKVASNPPDAELPKVEQQPAAPAVDTAKLVGQIDADLKQEGISAVALPPAPEAAEVLNTTLSKEDGAQPTAHAESQLKPVSDSGLLSSIDEKLKTRGIEPPKVELPPPPSQSSDSSPKIEQAKKVELEPKLADEKGPLFLESGEVQSQANAEANRISDEESRPSAPPAKEEPAIKELPAWVVKGPPEPASQTAATVVEEKKPSILSDEESKGVFDQLREDAERLQKALNPFQW